MPSTESDAAAYATTSSTDFYEILGIPLTETSPSVLRKAFRKESLKWHPDKNPDPLAAETFHLLTIAYDVLSDPATRIAYDNARNARLAKKRRSDTFDVNRRRMQEDLERREGSAKRAKTDAEDAEDAFRRQMAKLAEEGAALRRKREEALRTAAKEASEEASEEDMAAAPAAAAAAEPEQSRFTELDRTLRLRWKRHSSTLLAAADLTALFSRFGRIQDCVVPPDAVTKPGQREKKLKTALLVFESIVSAHAAVHHDREGDSDFDVFKDITWASGQEPDISHEKPYEEVEKPKPTEWKPPKPTARSTAAKGKAPSFGSFAAKKSAPAAAAQGTDYESITLMRMRAAEKARIEAEIRRQDEQAGDGDL